MRLVRETKNLRKQKSGRNPETIRKRNGHYALLVQYDPGIMVLLCYPTRMQSSLPGPSLNSAFPGPHFRIHPLRPPLIEGLAVSY